MVSTLAAWTGNADDLGAFVSAGLHVDPPESGLVEERFPFGLQRRLAHAAADLALDATDGGWPLPAGLARLGVYEVLSATASALAWEDARPLDARAVADAVERVAAFAGEHGPDTVIRAYLSVALLEDLQAVGFYAPMPVRAFRDGRWHRPWTAQPLGDELALALVGGVLDLHGEGLELAAAGAGFLDMLRTRLRNSGMASARHRALARPHRHLVRHAATGDPHPHWTDVVAAAGIRPGHRVLVCGAGWGGWGLLLAAAHAVGRSGTVTVVDPVSRGGGADARLPGRVSFARGRLEALPLPEGSVDVALSPHFRHMGDGERILRELRRVLRPGGRVALAVPHALHAAGPEWREWLQPLHALAARLDLPSPDGAASGGEALDALARHGFVQAHGRPGRFAFGVREAVSHLLDASDTCRTVLERTPWQERHALLAELVQRGERLWREASGGDLTAPGELVVGTCP
jgi:SAM-dependent methyltransferase